MGAEPSGGGGEPEACWKEPSEWACTCLDYRGTRDRENHTKSAQRIDALLGQADDWTAVEDGRL